jgi:hypothetical protein
LVSLGVKIKIKMNIQYQNKIFIAISLLICSCTTIVPQKTAIKYYKKNEAIITRIEENYKKIFVVRPIVIEFTDNYFKYASIEIKTDSIRYIYEFNIYANKIKDTLLKFGFDTAQVMNLIFDMKKIKCTWINTLDYYVEEKKLNLIFMSMRPVYFDFALAKKSYYTLTFYEQKQYYDVEGRLLDKKNTRLLRIVNNEIFWRINDRVCFTISNHFR